MCPLGHQPPQGAALNDSEKGIEVVIVDVQVGGAGLRRGDWTGGLINIQPIKTTYNRSRLVQLYIRIFLAEILPPSI